MNTEQHRLLTALASGAKLELALDDAGSWFLDTDPIDPAAPDALYTAGYIERGETVVGYWFTPFVITEAGRAAADEQHTPTLWERVKGWFSQ